MSQTKSSRPWSEVLIAVSVLLLILSPVFLFIRHVWLTDTVADRWRFMQPVEIRSGFYAGNSGVVDSKPARGQVPIRCTAGPLKGEHVCVDERHVSPTKDTQK